LIIIYLCIYTSLFKFISLKKVPLPYFGFLACGVYPFHLLVS